MLRSAAGIGRTVTKFAQKSYKMSHTEGLNAMETALRCVEQQDDTASDDLLLLRRLQNIATKKRGTAIKQKTVEDLFMKV
jgi:hypothetical protein